MTTNDLRALDLVPEAVVVVDGDGRLRYGNDRAAALLGVGPSALGQRLCDVVSLVDDSGEPIARGFTATALPPGHRLAERVVQLVRPDGRRRPVAVSGRRAAEDLVLTFRSAGRRERVDRARSNLVATVSHEIRSPLTSVKGFTRTMLLRWDRFSDEQKRTMLQTVNEDADRVTRLLTELLDVSRIDAGRVQLRRQLVDIAGIVYAVADKVAHRPEGGGRDLGVTVDRALGQVFVDPDKFEQMLTNLVENALKYAPDSRVEVHAAAEDATLHVQVADHGPGIPLDQQRRIFEKFGRGRGERRTGTGLGLYITRGLAEAHGGRVWCESEAGKGSIFHVVLPLSAPEPRQPA